MNVLLLLVWLLLTPTPTPDTAIRISVHNAQAQPVVGLTLTVKDAGGLHILTTDANGSAVAHGLAGDTIQIRAARTASGQTMQIDPTTVKAGLQLRLLPHATRTAVLLLDGTLLQLDPTLVLAGSDQTTPPVAVAPSPAPRSSAALRWAVLGGIAGCLGLVCFAGIIIALRIRRATEERSAL